MQNLKNKIEFVVNLYKSRKLEESKSNCAELIRENPKIVFLYNLMGLILTEQNNIIEAIKFYKKGIIIDPKFAIIYNNLGNSYKIQNNLIDAERLFKKSINIDNKNPEPHNNLGNLYKSTNKFEDSIKCYKNAIKINPKFYWSHYNLGIINIALGRFEEAKKNLQETIKINKYLCSAHRTLGRITKYTLNSNHIKQMKELFDDKNIGELQKIQLSFAIGKFYEDVKDYKNSFNFYYIGNTLQKKNINYSFKDEEIEFNNIKNTFTKYLNVSIKSKPHSSTRMIFILGMPRSGTTLVEQILSNHPKVFGGDELNFIPRIISKNYKNIFNGSLISADFENFADEYIDNINKFLPKSEFVTDKLPINFKWIGFIKLLFPNSKIIHCKRNSKDNCLSIFKNYFTNKNLNFAYDLNDITLYYNIYNELMTFWNKQIPNFIINLSYEEMIKNPDEQIRFLIKSCNLDWDDNCLSFYTNKRIIKTASDFQARNKIFNNSLNSWKNYSNFLDPYFKKLKS